MKSAGKSIIFEISDMIGSSETQCEVDGNWCRAVPHPFYDGLLARIRAAWEIVCGRAYPVRWPEAGELEVALLDGSDLRIERRASR